MGVREVVLTPRPEFDPVQEASEGSFPASDPPAWTITTGVGMTRREFDRDGRGDFPIPKEQSPEPRP